MLEHGIGQSCVGYHVALVEIALTLLERAVDLVSGFSHELAFSATSSCWHLSISLDVHSPALVVARFANWRSA